MISDKSIEVKGSNALTKGDSIEIVFWPNGTFNLNIWHPSKGGRRGVTLSRPEAVKEYALSLLAMAEEFEEKCRPEFEARGGRWMTDEEKASALRGETVQ